jgi:glutathione S-transferase
MSTTTTEPITLNLSRLIKAPRERIFKAWTTPSEIVKWLGCDPSETIEAKIDLRVGGKYSIRMNGCDGGGETTVEGVYREIKPPSSLVFTWEPVNSSSEMNGMFTVVTVELVEQKDGTLVQITHVGFPSDEIRDRHNKGWTASLEHLAKLV